MSATIMREKRQTTLPADVVDAAGIKQGDRLDWSFEEGKIVGRKLSAAQDDILDLDDVDPVTLTPKQGKITDESIVKAIRADRDSR
jgi:bifunctional DNA-binding transcriptional regulator/antitoxin component of YhaV-PrlF toxin-antitoxin module